MTRVYTFGPTFRAENSNTSRHLSEFWMVEPEIAFADLADNADLAEDLLKYVFRAVLDERADDMAFFAERIDPEAVDAAGGLRRVRLRAHDLHRGGRPSWRRPGATGSSRSRWGVDLQAEHERYLCEELAGRPVVVVDYPKEIKAFYMRLNDDERTVAAMDVLAPGHRRDHRRLASARSGSTCSTARIEEMGLETEPYGWYRDLRRYGTVPHAGFGLGFDRALAYATGMANIRDVIPFPRTPGQRRVLVRDSSVPDVRCGGSAALRATPTPRRAGGAAGYILVYFDA